MVVACPLLWYRRQELNDTGRRDDEVLMFAPCCSRVALDYSRRIG
jgi:hypothetical protein